MKTESQKRADANYRARTVRRVPLDLHRRDYAGLYAAVQSTEEKNISAFIKSAINEKIDRKGLREIADKAAAEYDKKQLSENKDDVV